MLELWQLGSSLQDWQVWASLIVGLVSTSVALAAGRMYLRRKSGLGFKPANSDMNYLLQSSDPFSLGSDEEKRRSPRRRGRAVGIIVSDSQGSKKVCEGSVIDRSVGGLCLSLPASIDCGTVVNLRVTDEARASWVPVEIRNCRMVRGHWQVGCSFVYNPSWDVLMQFG